MAAGFRVAVIGYGLAGRAFHAPFVASTPGLRLGAVVTGNPERARAVRERYPDTAVMSTVDDLWAAADAVDLVVVASPNRFHVEQATAALEAGLSVVVDKPVAATGEEIRKLVELAERGGRMLTVFQNRRWDGDFLTVRELLANDRLGPVTRFESRFERSTSGPRTAWKVSPDPADLTNILYDLGSHLIDQAITLFGPPSTVYAETSSPRLEVPVPEDATVLLTHGGGVRSYLRMSNAVIPAAPRFAVLGARAGFRCWGLDRQEAASVAGRWPTEPGFGAYLREQWGELITADAAERVPTAHGSYLTFWERVVACLNGEAAPPVPPAESVVLVDTIEAALRSAGSGQPVAL
jgi:scyllo-inositol 2-dehydrogenase (NADP+)